MAAVAIETLDNLSDFTFERVLSVGDESLAVLAKRGDDPAVLVYKRSAFSEDTAAEVVQSSIVSTVNNNDVYYQFTARALEGSPQYSLLLICPAGEADITKYTAQEYIVVRETAEDYATLTAAFVESRLAGVGWVHNILDHKAESEHIIFENEHFLLVPDFKWDREDVSQLYCLALVKPRDLPTIRSLTDEHISMLESVRDDGLAAIQEKYGVPSNKMQVFFHYLPSFYHLHMHFVVVGRKAAMDVGKAVLLDDVIQNIKLKSTYYQEATLTYTLGSAVSGLYDNFVTK